MAYPPFLEFEELKVYGSEEEPHTFCSECGSPLARKTYFSHYSHRDGKPIYYTKLYCSKFFFGLFHTSWKFDDKGNEILSRDYT